MRHIHAAMLVAMILSTSCLKARALPDDPALGLVVPSPLAVKLEVVATPTPVESFVYAPSGPLLLPTLPPVPTPTVTNTPEPSPTASATPFSAPTVTIATSTSVPPAVVPSPEITILPPRTTPSPTATRQPVATSTPTIAGNVPTPLAGAGYVGAQAGGSANCNSTSVKGAVTDYTGKGVSGLTVRVTSATDKNWPPRSSSPTSGDGSYAVQMVTAPKAGTWVVSLYGPAGQLLASGVPVQTTGDCSRGNQTLIVDFLQRG